MNTNTLRAALLALPLLCTAATASAQVNAADSVMNHASGRRFSVGGYGEVALTRNFYSDNVYRYTNPSKYRDDKSHGRFDVPHAVVYLSYDFGHGWTMSSEIEFEHGGGGSAYEKEFTEAGEWEHETEKGGEVELEQFWLQKSFARWINVRVGHIVVPVGLNNAHHEPLNFFTVYRPEGEDAMLPSTWHDTGISLWGRVGLGRQSSLRYEAQLLAGLDGFMFDRDHFIHYGAGSPFEFKVANQYGLAGRLDFYAVPGVRIGLSGYYGQSMHNTFPHDMETTGGRWAKVKAITAVGAVDFTLDRWNWVVRGQADYGYVGDAAALSEAKRNQTANNAPFKKNPVGKNALAVGIEAGYDVFSQVERQRAAGRRLFVFGRYEHYDTYLPSEQQASYPFTRRDRVAAGINYYPLRQIAVKAEWSKRFLRSPYNDEPSVSLGIAYEGFFL